MKIEIIMTFEAPTTRKMAAFRVYSVQKHILLDYTFENFIVWILVQKYFIIILTYIYVDKYFTHKHTIMLFKILKL